MEDAPAAPAAPPDPPAPPAPPAPREGGVEAALRAVFAAEDLAWAPPPLMVEAVRALDRALAGSEGGELGVGGGVAGALTCVSGALQSWLVDSPGDDSPDCADPLQLVCTIVSVLIRCCPPGAWNPLLPLLEASGAGLPAGVAGLRAALRLLTCRGAEGLRPRAALASSLARHLRSCPADLVFEFPDPDPGSRSPSSGQHRRQGQPDRGDLAAIASSPSSQCIELPRTLTWEGFRGYTVALWLQVDSAASSRDITLFDLRASGGEGLEVTLSACEEPAGARRALKATSFTRGATARSAAVMVEGLAGVSERGDGRCGPWRLVTFSHSLPYLKKPLFSMSVDAECVLQTDLPYPASAQAAGGRDDAFLSLRGFGLGLGRSSAAGGGGSSRGVVCNGLIGRVAFVGMFEGDLSQAALRVALDAGPGQIPFLMPLFVPRAHVELQTAALRGPAAKAGIEAHLLWAYVPRLALAGSASSGMGFVPSLVLAGRAKLRHTDIAGPPSVVQRGGGGGSGSMARLCGEVHVVSTYSGGFARGRPPAGFFDVQDAWLRAGGVRSVLYIVGVAVDEAATMKPEADSGLALLLMELLCLLRALLESSQAHREEALHSHAFHLTSAALQRLPRPSSQLDPGVLAACLGLLDAALSSSDALYPSAANSEAQAPPPALVGAVLQGLLLDFGLWAGAHASLQSQLICGIASVLQSSKRSMTAALARYVGVQRLLDILRVHICTDILGAVAAAPADCPAERSGEEAGADDCIRSAVDACEQCLLAVLEWDLIHMSMSSSRLGMRQSPPSPEVSLPPPTPKSTSGAASSRKSFPPEVSSPLSECRAMDAIIMCLHESRSPSLLVSLLRTIIQLRQVQSAPLCRALSSADFASLTAPVLLCRRGYPRDVRVHCLTLVLWLLHDTAKGIGGSEHGSSPSSSQSTPVHVILARCLAQATEAGVWTSDCASDALDVLSTHSNDPGWAWLVLPFVAALGGVAPMRARQRLAMDINIALKSDDIARQHVLSRSGLVWLESLLELAISDYMPGTPEGRQHVSLSHCALPHESICEELALDAIACLLVDAVAVQKAHWQMWHRLLSGFDLAAHARLGGADMGRAWLEFALSRLIVNILQRTTRGGVPWSNSTLDGVARMVALADERLAHAQAQPHLMKCLIETSKGLRRVLEGEERRGSGSSLTDEDHQLNARRRLRAQAVLRVLLRVLIRELAIPPLIVDGSGGALGDFERLATDLAAESMASLRCLLRCPEVPVAAGLQAVLQVYVGFEQAIQAAEGQSSTLKDFLSATVMDEVSRLGSSAPAAAPAVVAARRLLRPAASCTSSQDVFRALRPEMEAFQAEVKQDSHDFVPLFSAEGEARPATVSAINLIVGSEGQQKLSEAWLEESVSLHKDRTDAERRNLKRRMDALDVLGGGVRKAWVRMSRSVEAEVDAHFLPLMDDATGMDSTAHLTGKFRRCELKLTGGQHEGCEPGRTRVVLAPVVDPSPRSLAEHAPAPVLTPEVTLLSEANSAELLGQQLAKCSQYIVDITKRENLDQAETAEGGQALDEGPWTFQDSSPGIDLGEGADTMYEDEESESGMLTARQEQPSAGDFEEDRSEKHDVLGEAEAGGGGEDGGEGFGSYDTVSLGPDLSHPRLPEYIARQAARGSSIGELGTLVTPKGNSPGWLIIVKRRLYFAPIGDSADGGSNIASVTGGGHESAKLQCWPLNAISAVYARRYRLVDSALEFFLSRGKRQSVFVDFGVTADDVERRDEFIRLLGRVCGRGVVKSGLIEANRLMRAWQERRISNYDYIMALNTVSGRSYNDLCQYPVFPWVLSCYGAETLDLEDPKCFRDLSRPVGALNDERLAEFLDRYESFQDPDIPAFMYGSHYSTAVGVVLHFLVRLQPFASLHRTMQNGTFDVPDRLFSSIPRSWELCTSALSEVKELTPEWYSLPDFLRNVNGYSFGRMQDGVEVGDVILPRWARDPEDFIRKHRAALESPHVTQHLHKWVDLIFGYKQQGQAAVTSHNVFYYLTYYGAIDLTQIKDESLRRATELQIAHFGQCPMQLFVRPHPQQLRRTSVPRPVGLSLASIDSWIEEGSRVVRRSARRVTPLSRAEVGVKCMRILSDGRILMVNGLGVIELFVYSWRDAVVEDSHSEDELAGARDAPSPRIRRPFSPESGDNFPGDGEDDRRRGGFASGSSGLDIQRLLPQFDVLPRIPVPSGNDYFCSHRSLPLPPAPVLFSSSGRFVFSGSHSNGSLMVWEIDPETGAIVAEGSILGHAAPVTCLAVCGLEAEGFELILSGSSDCTAALWTLRQLSSSFQLPFISRSPTQIFRGHGSPITACAVSASLHLALTCSRSTVLLHSLREDQLLHCLGPRRSLDRSDDRTSSLSYSAAALSPLGFAILAAESHRSAASLPPSSTLLKTVYEVSSFTVSGGVRVAKISYIGRPVRTLKAVNELVIIGGDCSLLEVRAASSLDPIWTMNPASVVAASLADRPGVAPEAANGPSSSSAITSIEIGPNPEYPIFMCLGFEDGCMLVQALPGAEQWLGFNMLSAVGSIINMPVRMVRGKVHQAQSIAVSGWRRVTRAYRTGERIVRDEVVGEANTLVKGVQRAGIVKGVLGYMKGANPPSENSSSGMGEG